MIKKPPCHNRYNSARQRFLKAVIENFFAREFPRFFGPVIRQKLAEQLLRIFEDEEGKTQKDDERDDRSDAEEPDGWLLRRDRRQRAGDDCRPEEHEQTG